MKSLFLLLSAFAPALAYVEHMSSDSTYVHSNDTIQLRLRGDYSGEHMRGRPDSQHRIELALVNKAEMSEFTLRWGM